MSKKFNQ